MCKPSSTVWAVRANWHMKLMGIQSEYMTTREMGDAELDLDREMAWVLDEKTGIEHIKYAYEQGINTFE